MEEETNKETTLNIRYKKFDFKIGVTNIGICQYLIGELANPSNEDVITRYKETIYFEKFLNEGIEATLEKLTLSVKRSFRNFVNNEDNSSDVTQPFDDDTAEESNSPSGAIDKIIFDTVSRALGSNSSKQEIDKLIKKSMDENGVVPFRKVLELKKKNGTTKDVGLQHMDFERVLKTIAAGVNIALVGPAGSGKTTIVYNASKALDLSFASQSVSAQSTVFDFFGYKNAKGDYVETLFREKYEKGGVFLLDEFDAGNPNVLAALNQATANGHCPFPDKMIKKHKDFIIVMAGNTFGSGATIDYVGRNKIDAATLDRFAFINIQYDEHLEMELATDREWCQEVQDFRKKALNKKIRTIISPRATFNGEALLSQNISKSDVLEMVIFKGMTQDERNLLNS
mgnify:FL=1|tara:strand:- start:11880 stop:13073 length:1194 start_codon:yes stop_codon:yes gene_type:complete